MSSQSCWSFYTPLHFPFLFLFSLFVSFLDSCPSESKGVRGCSWQAFPIVVSRKMMHLKACQGHVVVVIVGKGARGMIG